jgi:UPF0755 protein
MLFKTIKYLLLIIAGIAAIVVFSYYSDVDSPVNSSGLPIKVVVSSGEGVKNIGQDLFKKSLIKSVFHFQVYLWLTKNGSNIQAGSYLLSPSMTMKKIVAVMIAGKTVNEEKEITVIPGWNLRDIADYFQQQGVAPSSDLYKLTGEPLKKYASGQLPDYSGKFSILADKPKGSGLEGYLFPDTYRIFKNATTSDIIIKMIGNLDEKVTPAMRADIAAEGKSVFQIITLASIIEKEVRNQDDMKIVSGIFWNRLKINQSLGSDATLSYILGDKNAAHSTDQTMVNSPYNTYRSAGLPPGPICNPSLAAINAAIYPTKTNYYYFLTDPVSGKTIFSKTLDEHNRNKQKYLK